MAEIQKRLEELQRKSETDLDHIERSALAFLHRAGFESLNVIGYTGKDKYEVWAAETIVWTTRRLRAGEWREALRGYGQLCGYKGQNGGFLPIGISDHVGAIQNALEARIGPRS